MTDTEMSLIDKANAEQVRLEELAQKAQALVAGYKFTTELFWEVPATGDYISSPARLAVTINLHGTFPGNKILVVLAGKFRDLLEIDCSRVKFVLFTVVPQESIMAVD